MYSHELKHKAESNIVVDTNQEYVYPLSLPINNDSLRFNMKI